MSDPVGPKNKTSSISITNCGRAAVFRSNGIDPALLKTLSLDELADLIEAEAAEGDERALAAAMAVAPLPGRPPR